MMRHLNRRSVPPLLTVALLLGGIALMPDARAQRVQRFSEAELFFELNDTDGDRAFTRPSTASLGPIWKSRDLTIASCSTSPAADSCAVRA